jgi:hypothetical protein
MNNPTVETDRVALTLVIIMIGEALLHALSEPISFVTLICGLAVTAFLPLKKSSPIGPIPLDKAIPRFSVASAVALVGALALIPGAPGTFDWILPAMGIFAGILIRTELRTNGKRSE